MLYKSNLDNYWLNFGNTAFIAEDTVHERALLKACNYAHYSFILIIGMDVL